MTAHIHADLMTEYAKDATETDKPWELWEASSHGGPWYSLDGHPFWDLNRRYRRKVKTKIVYQWMFKGPIGWHLSLNFAETEEEWRDKVAIRSEIRRLDYTAMEVPY